MPASWGKIGSGGGGVIGGIIGLGNKAGAVAVVNDGPFLGQIMAYGGQTPPDGWRYCDGVSLVVTPDLTPLFNLIGYLYGQTGQQFSLPDLRGLSPIAYASIVTTSGQPNLPNDLSTRFPPALGGTETNLLATVELPVHTHTLTDPGHMHAGPSASAFLVTSAIGDQYTLAGGDNGVEAAATDTNIASITVPEVGGPATHNNLMPYQVCCYIIRVIP